MSVWEALFAEQRVAILDGGLATELERAGFDLGHRLWSAKVLVTHPQAITEVHRAYLEAGADCIVTASYQASSVGLPWDGVGLEAVLDRAVALACEARDAFDATRPPDRVRPLVAASIGPYGAALADGSEYRGDYGLTRSELRAFHAPRFRHLAASPRGSPGL